MKKASRTAPIRRPNDPAKMTQALDELEKRGYEVFRPTEIQLKIENANYYPETGTIQIDSQRKLKGKGLRAFLELLEKRFGIGGGRLRH